MVFPSNISWFFKPSQNHKLPEYFSEYLLNTEIANYYCEEIEMQRKKLCESDILIKCNDKGAGSRILKNGVRKVSDIARHSATRYEQGLFMNKLINYYQIENVLELGTSLGIGTAYLSGKKEEYRLLSIDACENSQKIAKEIFESLNINNVTLINDEFDNVFESRLLEDKIFDLIFIDGNHKGFALLKYYQKLIKKYSKNRLILLIDDINWSNDMNRAWRKIVKNHSDSCSLDLFKLGIVFINYPNLPNGLFKVNYSK